MSHKASELGEKRTYTFRSRTDPPQFRVAPVDWKI